MPSLRPTTLLLVGALLPAAIALDPWLTGAIGPRGAWGQQPADEPGDAASPPAAHRNRLADEASPYLLAHAHNPVDWYPWGPEALERAERENKPIFLSIGYSACHWCHVMEREAFSDAEVAAFLNRHFVCIKVDREERPDIDHIYMTGLHVFQQLSGSRQGGGWPLSMFLTPEAKPFFGGTYFPARDGDREGIPGFLTLATRIHEVWSEQSELLERDAEAVTQATRRELAGQRPDPLYRPSRESITQGLDELAEQFDPRYGGFGFDPDQDGRPKFPEPSNLRFLAMLVRLEGRDPDGRARRMLETTLDRMAAGGIHDQLGGGFHRYSVDRRWEIPHFEKMLYDNAQLLSVYAEAFALTGKPEYRGVAERLVAFLEREMRTEEGAYASALDADSEGEEGKFYRWRPDQIREVLSEEQWTLARTVWGLDRDPNFEGQDTVLTVVAVGPAESDEAGKEGDAAVGNGAEPSLDADPRMEAIRATLLAVRETRPRPARDDKVLLAWNGALLRGWADAARYLEDRESLARATALADLLLAEMVDDQDRLSRSRIGGETRLNAYLDDYAMLVDGLIALHQARAALEGIQPGDDRYLQRARRLTDVQIERFHDGQDGGFFYTSDDHESLLARAKNPVDSVLPSGNSVTVTNLVALGRITGEPRYLDLAEETLRTTSNLLQRRPSLVPHLLMGLEQFLEVRGQQD